jgi:hypothetical protein
MEMVIICILYIIIYILYIYYNICTDGNASQVPSPQVPRAWVPACEYTSVRVRVHYNTRIRRAHPPPPHFYFSPGPRHIPASPSTALPLSVRARSIRQRRHPAVSPLSHSRTP